MAIAYNTSIVRDGLILYLDAANKKSYSGTGTAWNDLSGNGNNLQLINNPIYNSSFFTFDGIDDYATIDSSQLYVNGSINSVTYNMWFNFHSIEGAGTYKALFGGQRNQSAVLMVYNADGSWKFRWFWDDGVLTTNSSFMVDKWNNVSVVLEAPYYVTIYLNGTEILPKVQSTDTITSILSVLSLARQNRDIGTPLYEYANVDISMFSQYARALSANEINQNFEALRGRYNV
jgi:hypothetical protein